MAITAEENIEDSGMTWSISPGANGIGMVSHEYERSFTVHTEDPTIREREIMLSGVLPSLGTIWSVGGADEENDRASCVVSIRLDRVGDSQTEWLATLSYETINPDFMKENPLESTAKASWSSEDFEELVNEDREGNQILNTAGSPFVPGVVRTTARSLLNVVRVEESYNEEYARSIRYSVNSDTFLGSDPGSVLVRRIEAEPLWDATSGTTYWTIHYQFAFAGNSNTWARKIQNVGYEQIVDGERQAIILSDGKKPDGPVPLDADGVVIPVGSDPEAITLTFELYPEIDFEGTFNFSGVNFGNGG